MKPSKINRIYFIWLRGQYQLCKPYVCWLWEKLKVCLATTYLFSVYIHTQHSWTSLNSDERLREEKNNFFSLQINGKEEKNGEKIMNYTVALEHRIRIIGHNLFEMFKRNEMKCFQHPHGDATFWFGARSILFLPTLCVYVCRSTSQSITKAKSTAKLSNVQFLLCCHTLVES